MLGPNKNKFVFPKRGKIRIKHSYFRHSYLDLALYLLSIAEPLIANFFGLPNLLGYFEGVVSKVSKLLQSGYYY